MGLSIVAGCGESRILAEDIFNILKYKLKVKDINLILPKKSCDFSEGEKDNKSERQLCVEIFPDSEVRIEIGEDELNKLKDNVIFVKYLYEPKFELSINDNIMEAIAFGELIRNKKISKLTYVLPYLPYVRAHSVDKYLKEGFYQADTLKIFVKMMEMIKVDEIIAIDPHSKKIWDYCDECNIKWQSVDPFNSQEFGIFRKFYEQNKDDYDDLVIVVPDEGGFKRSRDFALNIGKREKDVAIIDKKRTDVGQVDIRGFIKGSKFTVRDVKGKNFLIIDDMISSGGTVNRISKFLKNKGANRIETWVSHAVSPKPEKVEKLAVDKVIVLDTILQNIKKLNYIKAADNLLAHAIFKSLK